MVSGHNQLVSINKGEIEVGQKSGRIIIYYKIYFTEMLLVITIGVIGFLGPFVWFAPNLADSGKLLVLFLAWAWLFGVNYLITAFRFPRFLKRAANKVLGGKGIN